MGGGKGAGDPDPPPPAEKSQTDSFFSNTGPKPLKNQASFQCWTIIDPPAKRHLNDDGPLLVVLGSLLPHYLKIKKPSELDPLLQNFLDPRMRTTQLIDIVLSGSQGLKCAFSALIMPNNVNTRFSQN